MRLSPPSPMSIAASRCAAAATSRSTRASESICRVRLSLCRGGETARTDSIRARAKVAAGVRGPAGTLTPSVDTRRGRPAPPPPAEGGVPPPPPVPPLAPPPPYDEVDCWTAWSALASSESSRSSAGLST